MRYYQGSVVEVPFNLSQKVENHPAIIVSCDNANEEEGTVVCVMTTHNRQEDDFTFKLHPQMFDGNLPPDSYQARLHLVSLFIVDRDIIINNHRNVKMKRNHFDRMMERLLLVTFGYRLNINTTHKP